MSGSGEGGIGDDGGEGFGVEFGDDLRDGAGGWSGQVV